MSDTLRVDARPQYPQGVNAVTRGQSIVITLSAGTVGAAQDTTSSHNASSGYKYVGEAINNSDNTALSTNPPDGGMLVVEAQEAVLKTFDSVAATDIGKPCYIKTPTVASLTNQSGQAALLGIVHRFVSATSAYVDIRPGVSAVPA